MALRRTDVDLSDGEDVVVTLRRSKTNPADERPDVRRLVGGGAAAVRRLARRNDAGADGSGRRIRCQPDQPALSPPRAPRPG